MRKARVNEIDKPPTIEKCNVVELNRKYFRYNQRDAPFTPGTAYEILDIVDNVKGYERDGKSGSVYFRTAVILSDDSGKKRRIDASFLVKPGWWDAHKDDPEEVRLTPLPRGAMTVLKHPEHAPPEDPGEGMWGIDTEEPAEIALPGPRKTGPRVQYCEFSRILKEERVNLDLTFRDVSERLGVTESYARDLERKLKNPKLSTAQRAFLAIGIDGDRGDELMRRAGYDTNSKRDNEFGSALKALRLKKGLTQAELAELVYISSGYLSALETGIYPGKTPHWSVMKALADALELEGEKREGFLGLRKDHRLDDGPQEDEEPPQGDEPASEQSL